MQQIQRFVKVSVFLLGVYLSLFTALSVSGEEATKKKFSISGIVMDVPNLHQTFDKIEEKAPKTEEKFNQFFRKWKPLVAKNVTVMAKSNLLTKKTTTNSKGNFKFTGLPAGEYKILAQAPSRPTGISGKTRMAIVEEHLSLTSNINGLKLRLRTDLINIKGRITDTNNRTIAKTKITAIEDFDDPSNMRKPKTWSTVSNSDGYFELQGLEPISLYRLAGCLPQGDPNSLMQVYILAEKTGFIQDKKNVPKVSLITIEQLIPARRLLKIYSQMPKKIDGFEFREKKGLTFPASEGNTITGIDIVLKKIKTKAK